MNPMEKLTMTMAQLTADERQALRAALRGDLTPRLAATRRDLSRALVNADRYHERRP